MDQSPLDQPVPPPSVIHGDIVLPGLRAFIKIKAKSPPGMRQGKSSRATYLEIATGDELHSGSGELHGVERVIDHANDRYFERITAPDGTIIHEVDEPLSEHHGRGAAKPTQSSEDQDRDDG